MKLISSHVALPFTWCKQGLTDSCTYVDGHGGHIFSSLLGGAQPSLFVPDLLCLTFQYRSAVKVTYVHKGHFCTALCCQLERLQVWFIDDQWI
jgi:hypothetical protein